MEGVTFKLVKGENNIIKTISLKEDKNGEKKAQNQQDKIRLDNRTLNCLENK